MPCPKRDLHNREGNKNIRAFLISFLGLYTRLSDPVESPN